MRQLLEDNTETPHKGNQAPSKTALKRFGKKMAVGVCVSVMVLVACSSNEPIKSPPKIFSMDKEKRDHVSFMGRWRATAHAGLIMIPRINSVSVRCSKSEMSCRETLAQLFTPAEDKNVGHFLSAVDLVYPVVEWSDTLIRAEIKAPVADIELRISLADETAERSFRETRSRGVDTADPKISRHWTLE